MTLITTTHTHITELSAALRSDGQKPRMPSNQTEKIDHLQSYDHGHTRSTDPHYPPSSRFRIANGAETRAHTGKRERGEGWGEEARGEEVRGKKERRKRSRKKDDNKG